MKCKKFKVTENDVKLIQEILNKDLEETPHFNFVVTLSLFHSPEDVFTLKPEGLTTWSSAR